VFQLRQLGEVTPCSSCGTILFRTKPICSKRMRRLVSVRVFYTLGGGYIAYGITHKCGVAFLIVRRTQHVRGMRSSIVSVTYYDSTRFFMSCNVKVLGSATCPFLVQKWNVSFIITHWSVRQISSAVFKLQ